MARSIGKVEDLRALFYKKNRKELHKEFLDGVIELLRKHDISLTKALVKELYGEGGEVAKFP